MQGERSRKFALALLLMGLLAVAPVWSASDTQVYRVLIAPKLSLIPPQWGMIKSYPGLGTANVIFAPQPWLARCNSHGGCSVLLETSTAFRHTTTPSSKRDAKLDVTVDAGSGPGVWSVTTASSTTDYRRGNENARVRVSANGAGDTKVRLTVTFITGAPGTLQEGDYTTTIVGTISGN